MQQAWRQTGTDWIGSWRDLEKKGLDRIENMMDAWGKNGEHNKVK